MHVSAPPNDPLVIVVMGVSGCGKSTVAQYLAEQIGAHFKDGDELHPDTNIEKMASGQPLNDDDREPWLKDVARYARENAGEYRVCVIACSALKQRYRQTLDEAGHVVYVFLEGSRALIASRMHERRGHFMPETLLDSQFEALEDPRSDPGAPSRVLTVSIEPDAVSIATHAANALRAHGHIA